MTSVCSSAETAARPKPANNASPRTASFAVVRGELRMSISAGKNLSRDTQVLEGPLDDGARRISHCRPSTSCPLRGRRPKRRAANLQGGRP